MSAQAPAGYATRRWNPITGCSAQLQCRPRCWARGFATRHRGRFGYPSDDPFRPTCHADRLDEPMHWRKPQTVAVAFMGDLFDPELQPDFVVEVMIRMERAVNIRGHRFLVLTKQAGLMADFLQGVGVSPSPNIWWGVSVENREALSRVDDLRIVPSSSLWISLEPQIGDVGALDLRGISFVVQGCESGPRRRPFDVQWAIDVRDACRASGVCYYLKQIDSNGRVVHLPELDGQIHASLPWGGSHA